MATNNSFTFNFWIDEWIISFQDNLMKNTEKQNKHVIYNFLYR